MAVIEGAAGSGKTTTLRPITDLLPGARLRPSYATAVAWRTAVALGNDVRCPAGLRRQAPEAWRRAVRMEIGKDTTLIVVDEAGMLSTRQAHHILRNSGNATGRRSCSPATRASSSRWRRDRDCG